MPGEEEAEQLVKKFAKASGKAASKPKAKAEGDVLEVAVVVARQARQEPEPRAAGRKARAERTRQPPPTSCRARKISCTWTRS